VLARRFAGWALVVGAALLACAVVAPSSALATVNENQIMSASYSGTLTFKMNQPAIPGTGPAKDTETVTFTWEMGVSYSLAEIQQAPVRWKINELGGEVSDEGVAFDGEPYACRGSFSLNENVNPGEIPGAGAFLEPYGSGEEPQANNWTVRPPLGIPTEVLISSVAVPSGGDYHCNTEALDARAAGDEGVWFDSEHENEQEWLEQENLFHAAAAPTVYFPAVGSYTQPVNYSFECEAPKCNTESEGPAPIKRYGGLKWNINSSITFSPGSSAVISPTQPGPTTSEPSSPPSSSPPPTPKNTDPRKHDAAADLPQAFKAAEVPCAAAALGSVAAASKGGVLTSAVGGPGASQQLGDAGQAVLSGWGPLCDAALDRIMQDFRTAADPPAADWHQLAQPAKAKKGKPARACKHKKPFCELSAAQARVVVAAQRVAAVDEAIETTISRETAALDASDRASAESQSSHAAALEGEFLSALAGESTAENKLKSDLRQIGARISVNGKQTAKGIQLMLGRLTAQGIDEAQLKPYVGSAL